MNDYKSLEKNGDFAPKEVKNEGCAESADGELTSEFLINRKVFDLLPELLKVECDKFDDKEKDIFFLSMMTLISGIIKNVYGDYSNRKVYPNLFLNITMNAGTGKGNMSFAKDAGEILHKFLIKDSDNKSQVSEEFSNKTKTLFIPGNSSSAALISCLKSNDGSGIIFESESDTLANSLKQEWGGFSDALRKAFHHEPISDNKNSGNGFVEIENPKLSVIISGTPNQIPQLLQGVGDGLVSRFIFYISNSRPTWKNPFLKKFESDYFRKVFGVKILELYQYFCDNELIEFSLSKEQQKRFNVFFEEKTEILKKHYSYEMDGSIFRYALISYRIMMILTAIRNFDEKKDQAKNLLCSDFDFETGLLLFDSLFDHTLEIFKLFPKGYDKSAAGIEGKILSMFADDKVYPTAEIISVTGKFKISERSIKDHLNKMLSKGILTQPKHGFYQISKSE